MAETPVGTFVCPSRRSVSAWQAEPWADPLNAAAPEACARSDYAACVSGGYSDVFRDRWLDVFGFPQSLDEAADEPRWQEEAFFGGQWQPNGAVIPRYPIRLKEITDGTSRTYVVGEKNINPDRYFDGTSKSDDQCMYVGYDQDNNISAWEAPVPDTPGLEALWVFGGPHPGVFQTLLSDGSVQSVSFDIELRVHQAMGSRDGGEVETL